MWTPERRERHDRSGLRYPSDLSDEEWRIVEPLIPPGRRDLLIRPSATGNAPGST